MQIPNDSIKSRKDEMPFFLRRAYETFIRYTHRTDICEIYYKIEEGSATIYAIDAKDNIYNISLKDDSEFLHYTRHGKSNAIHIIRIGMEKDSDI